MCPQNSRKSGCVCDRVMDFPDRCHLSQPRGGDLHLPPPNGTAASAVNTFLACGDAETWSKFFKKYMFISKKQTVDAGNTYKTKIKYNFLVYLSSAKFWKKRPITEEKKSKLGFFCLPPLWFHRGFARLVGKQNKTALLFSDGAKSQFILSSSGRCHFAKRSRASRNAQLWVVIQFNSVRNNVGPSGGSLKSSCSALLRLLHWMRLYLLHARSVASSGSACTGGVLRPTTGN